MTDRFADSRLPDPSKSRAAAPGAPAPGATGAGGWVVEVVDEAAFAQLVEQSQSVPVVLDLWASWCEPCAALSPILEKVTADLGGRVLLAKVDVDKTPQIASAFGAQSIPTVVALVKGQPVPLFQGALPETQVRRFFDELLRAAATVGVTGVAASRGASPTPAPPLHQEGYDAIDRGDLPAAKAAFAKAVAHSPGDTVAKAALAQVELLERIDGAAGDAARADGVGATLEDTMAAADVDVASGQWAQGFNRLLSAMVGASPEDKETLRVRLLSLFDVAGPDEPTVAQARRRLAGLLF
ncbi:MAG: tetratricopeptide repeat protein [Bifidobacteriaceae bacterium]|jgi:putative thioredoxin|nr:tetratricopeptide repeat protein [Bifidobacteriaceae bacterium]